MPTARLQSDCLCLFAHRATRPTKMLSQLVVRDVGRPKLLQFGNLLIRPFSIGAHRLSSPSCRWAWAWAFRLVGHVVFLLRKCPRHRGMPGASCSPARHGRCARAPSARSAVAGEWTLAAGKWEQRACSCSAPLANDAGRERYATGYAGSLGGARKRAPSPLKASRVPVGLSTRRTAWDCKVGRPQLAATGAVPCPAARLWAHAAGSSSMRRYFAPSTLRGLFFWPRAGCACTTVWHRSCQRAGFCPHASDQ